jgi:gamma-glutamyltranspeptidase/glutathione hydrolase
LPAGQVAAGHPEVSNAAALLLRAGGNAFDAAIAAGFAAAVAEPMFTSLGGGGFLLSHTAPTRASASGSVLFDFFADTPGRGREASGLSPHFVPITVHFPASEQVFNICLGSVAVPGNLLGFLHVHRRLGRAPLSDVVAPAVSLARDGIALTEHQAYVIELLRPINTLTEAGRRLYAPSEARLAPGDRIINRELADFMEDLPRGSGRELYEGTLAAQIGEEMRAGGGLLTEEDLRRYAVVEREPMAIAYRGWQLLSNPRPALGGALIALSLALHESQELEGWGSGGHLRCLAVVMEEVERLRRQPEFAGGHFPVEALEAARKRVRVSSGGTTHISVTDADGNAASMSLSNGEGSGYFAPGTGVMLNNMLGEDDLHPDGFHASPPGQRVASMMSPSLLMRDGEVRLILGSGGSKRIRTALVQVILDTIDFGMEIGAAVEAPRIQWDGEQLQVEPGFSASVIAELQESWSVNAWAEPNLYFGGVHAVAPGTGEIGDPRRGGHAREVR